jgi:exopolysaccharide production protein ExoQ
MPPQLALSICTGFVVWLLFLDNKQSKDVSAAIWIPTIWLLIMASKPLALWFDVMAEDMQSGSPIDRNVFLILLTVGLIILAKKKFEWFNELRANPFLLLLLGYMFISILWSDIPMSSFKQWIRELIAVVMSFIIASEKKPQYAIQCIIRRLSYIVIPYSYLVIHYFPIYGREYNRWTGELMWCGVATQKNGLGLICLTAALYIIWSMTHKKDGYESTSTRYQKYLDVSILLLALWLMGGPQHNLTYSVTSNATLFLGIMTICYIRWLKKRNITIGSKTLLIIITIIIIYGTITPFIGRLALFDITTAVGRDATLTGRSEIWERLMPYAIDRIIMGHGYGGFWTDQMREKTASHAHNGYLDIILNMGILGIALFTLFILACCKRAYREIFINMDWGAYFIGYIVMAVFHNIAESSSVGLTGKLSAIILFMAVASTKENYMNREDSKASRARVIYRNKGADKKYIKNMMLYRNT